jgi:hypothetical protein
MRSHSFVALAALITSAALFIFAALITSAALFACDRPADSVRVLSNANETRPSSDSADDRATSPEPASNGGASAAGTSPEPASNGGASAAATAGSTGTGAAAPATNGGSASCPEGKVKPTFEDGAWSVSGLACAQNTLTLNDRFVLRAIPGGGDSCACPPNVPCAPCLPTLLFRDQPGAELYVVLRTDFPDGLVDGTRADVPVRLLSWGEPTGPVAQLFWDP